MDNIIEPNESFDFSKISLAHPTGIQGGAYFTKIEFNKKPLYIQTLKSLSRQGFVKSGKKYYCDLMFDKNSETLINWFENLEEKCKKLIYEKKDAWFQGNLEETDIENAFNPLIRVYKSGKFYLLRTNIKNAKDDTPAVKIYNENEIYLNMSDITSETEMISILEIQGIKFTSRNFQIEIELKQVMVLDNEPIFESCLIKPNRKTNEHKPLDEHKPFDEFEAAFGEKPFDEFEAAFGEKSLDEHKNLDVYKPLDKLKIDDNIKPIDDLEPMTEEKHKNIINSIKEEVKAPINSNIEEINDIVNSLEEFDPTHLLKSEEKKDEEIALDIEFEDLTDDNIESGDVLREINNNDLNLDKNVETITLKKPNQVYFELYKEARTKAKEAKKKAILAYLEAKNIKKTYMIENINDSDSDFDAEIEEASESELEGL